MTFKWNLLKNGEVEEVFYTGGNISLNDAIELCGITDADDPETEYELVFADEPEEHPYIVFEDVVDGDSFDKGYSTLEDACDMADYIWSHLTDREKNCRKVYVVKSANPDVDAPNHLDGDIVYSCS